MKSQRPPLRPIMRTLFALFLISVASLAIAGESNPCVFCEIVAGRLQSEGVVYRDEKVVAFLSIGPRNPGHVLVVPVAHSENFLLVPPDTMHAMTDAALKIAEAIKRADLKAEGFQVQINTGKAAGQSMFHAHLHVIPRFTGDDAPANADGQSSPIVTVRPPEQLVPMSELAPVAAKIRAALATAIPTSTTIPSATLRPQFALPALGEEVPLPRIREICEFYGLQALWRKIERDPPVRPFKSDGCTGWFDDWKGVSLYPAGFLHDLKYWAGYPGDEVERLVADSELMIDVSRLLGSTEMGETMFHGVRVGGSERLNTPFSWGFGRKPL